MILRKLIDTFVYRSNDYFHRPHDFMRESLNDKMIYYYDLRERVDYPGVMNRGMPEVKVGGVSFVHPVVTAQRGLGMLQRDAIRKSRSQEVVDLGYRSMEYFGYQKFAPTYPVVAYGISDWKSAMAQGQLSSFWARMYLLTGDCAFREASISAMGVMIAPVDMGGCTIFETAKGPIFMEVVHERAPFILNGHIISMLSLYDMISILNQDKMLNVMNECVDNISELVSACDVGWSLYDDGHVTICGIKIKNYASNFYHEFHIELLKSIDAVFGSVSGVSPFIRKWEKSLSSDLQVVRATSAKVLYKVISEGRVKHTLSVN